MKFKKYTTAFFTITSSLVFVFYIFAACSSVNAKDNVFLKELDSSDQTLTNQITKTELDFSSVTNLNFATAGSPISQVYFSAGSSCGRQCYIETLAITGTGGDGRVGTWTSGNLGGVTAVPNNRYGNSWWWKPNKEIKIEMKFIGFTKRICRVSLNTKNSYLPKLMITYLGDLKCSIYEAP